MANYLPVLLVSISTNAGLNANSDDSSLVTQPRGQVDYLSHDWEEEDVWRSWRNMTKQKNEIVNGVRLENASWRTWWKQRNKLPTVSPETLNWLKDSDVTWLYGPLHTAVDWAPPPKPKADPTSVDKTIPNPVEERLDLDTPSKTYLRKKTLSPTTNSEDTRRKSILKHRSISELLTSDFPLSASSSRLTSPRESDGESDGESESKTNHFRKRPPLPHTQSDSRIPTRPSNRVVDQLSHAFNSSPDGETSPSHGLPTRPVDELREHISDPGQTDSPGNEHDASPSGSTISVPTRGLHSNKKHKHITFNTFVEQCIAIEKPNTPRDRSAEELSGPRIEGIPVYESDTWNGKTKGIRWNGSEEEDGSSYIDDDVPPQSPSSDDASYQYPPPYASAWNQEEDSDSGGQSDGDVVYDENVFEDDDDESEEDFAHPVPTQRRNSMQPSDAPLERPGRHSSSTSRSQSNSSTSSGLSTDSGISSTTESSVSPVRHSQPRPRRRSHRSASEQVLLSGGRHRLSTSSQSSNATIVLRRGKSLGSAGHRKKKESHSHLTIAHIAPTVLKTGSSWDSFGSGYGDSHAHRSVEGEWMEGFGDEYSDDGIHRWSVGQYSTPSHRSPTATLDDSVELVYMPTNTGACRSSKPGKRKSKDLISASVVVQNTGEETGTYSHREFVGSQPRTQAEKTRSLPIVVRTPPAVATPDQRMDPYDYFGGPDLGEDYTGRSHSHRRFGLVTNGVIKAQEGSERGRSHSRTPSPIIHPSAPTPILKTSSSDGATSPSLLSPPMRGRILGGSSETSTSRGRSTTRTASSSYSDRDRSSHSSSIGSLSPEGNVLRSAVTHANGRVERGRDSGRGDRESRNSGQRGRERTERKLTNSQSPEIPGESVSFTKEVPMASFTLSSPSTGSGRPSLSSPLPIIDYIDQENTERTARPTPANSPTVPFKISSKPRGSPPKPSPTKLNAPSLSAPVITTSSSSSAVTPGVVLSRRPSGPMPAVGKDETSVVGKAVGIVSSAGAYLGFWHGDIEPTQAAG